MQQNQKIDLIASLIVKRNALQEEFNRVKARIDILSKDIKAGKYETDKGILAISAVKYDRVNYPALAMAELGEEHINQVKALYSQECSYKTFSLKPLK